MKFEPLAQRRKPSMWCNSCGQVSTRHCQTGRFCDYKSWGCKMTKIPWPTKQLLLSTSCSWDHWCVWQVHRPFLSGLAKKLVDMSGEHRKRQWLQQHLSLSVIRGNTASILACVQVWYDIAYSFLGCFQNVLTSNAACHMSLCQYMTIAFQFLVLSVSFIFPSVVQCYLVHWFNIFSVAQPMMRLQRVVMFHLSWNLWDMIN